MYLFKKELKWWKVSILCILLLVIMGIPSYTVMAKVPTKRVLLYNSISYCSKLTKSDYTTKTWTAFQKESKKVQSVYKKKNQQDEVYTTARNELEAAKANLMFVTSKDKGNPLPYRQLTVNQIVDEMGTGWNLGNTMDGNNKFKPSETAWQSVITTKAFIKTVHDMGYNTIRIPVTWGTMIDDKNGYKINDAWISRVQDIVDYAISQDMYAIINIHHDGGDFLNIREQDINSVHEKFEHVWRNIAEQFKDYDEHLIFESMNEVGRGKIIDDNKSINNFNQIFVNVVRSTGSNNSQRWLLVPGRLAALDDVTRENNGFEVPKDIVKSRIFVSVHYYDFKFGLDQGMEVTKFNKEDVDNLVTSFQKLVDRFTSKGIPLIIGEYGAVNKDNTAERTYFYEVITRICRNNGIVPVVWDNAYYDSNRKPDYGFSLYDRSTGKLHFPDIMNAILRGSFLSSTSEVYSDIVKNPKLINLTDLSLSDTALTMTIGDGKKITSTTKPANANEVVLWKTANSNIATVSNGHVRAKGIGTTTLTAFSLSGSVQADVTVTVIAKNSTKPSTSIVTDKESYKVVRGNYINLKVSLRPVGTDDYVTYSSSDESIATVSTLGKVVGCVEGTVNITITTSNGITKTVQINVSKQ